MYKVRTEHGYVTKLEISPSFNGYEIRISHDKAGTDLVFDYWDAMAVVFIVDNNGIHSWLQEV